MLEKQHGFPPIQIFFLLCSPSDAPASLETFHFFLLLGSSHLALSWLEAFTSILSLHKRKHLLVQSFIFNFCCIQRSSKISSSYYKNILSSGSDLPWLCICKDNSKDTDVAHIRITLSTVCTRQTAFFLIQSSKKIFLMFQHTNKIIISFFCGFKITRTYNKAIEQRKSTYKYLKITTNDEIKSQYLGRSGTRIRYLTYSATQMVQNQPGLYRTLPKGKQ